MGEMLSTKVSTEIAAREGVDPLQLDEPLYDAVDVGALERLVETAGREDGEFEVEFTYYGYDVVVDGSGEVTVTGGPAAAGETAGESVDRQATGR
ncbi:HalOD1 output domain-containing protein [Halosimplex halobium]|uniref:HalOD1 output domain-containing protein n=1 Tax=Halosimplex halobium TaxID=3396618 RepID=UPI003F55EBF9